MNDALLFIWRTKKEKILCPVHRTMDMWSIEDVKAWLLHTQQHDPTTGVVSPVLGFDGSELLCFFDTDNGDTRNMYFTGCAPFRLER